jgi:hypothetical protein
MVTLLYEDRTYEAPDAQPAGDELWLPLPELASATGWELKPEGVCRGELCVPLPQGREGEFLRGDQFNLAALARLLGQPVARDEAGSVWCFGEATDALRGRLESLIAPDFTLPDLEGRSHSLSHYRGRKVLLFTWASW